MKILPVVCRVLLGLMFVVFGANIMHSFLPVPPQVPGTAAVDWGNIMMASHWMKVVGFFQFLAGVLLLVGGTAPLGLVILAPIIVNVLCFHMFLTGGQGIGAGVFVGVLEVLLVYFYRASFAGIFSTKAKPVIKGQVV